MFRKLKTLVCPSVQLTARLFALMLVTQGIVGCVSTNSSDPTVVATALNMAPKEAPSSSAAPTPPPSSPTYVTATATITSSGVIAKSSAISVFASIGEVQTTSIQTTRNGITYTAPSFPEDNSANYILVPGVGALAFLGTYGDSH